MRISLIDLPPVSASCVYVLCEWEPGLYLLMMNFHAYYHLISGMK